MAIRAMWGFAHLPQKTTLGTLAGGYGLAYNGYGIVADAGYNTLSIEGNAIAIVNNTNAAVGFYVPAASITDGVAPKSIIGFRLRAPYLAFGSTISIGPTATTTAELGLVNGAEVYIEIICDRVTKEISFFVNGVFKLKKVTAVAPLIIGHTFAYATYRSGGVSNYLSDFYFIDDTLDDTPCSRLGAVTVKPLDSLTASGEGWTTPNAAPLLDVLNTPFTDAASILAPVASSPQDLAPIEVGISEPTTGLAPIKGIMFALSSRRIPSSAVGLDLGIKTGQSLKYGNATTFASDAITHSHSGVFQKAPDGTEWTLDKVKATTLVVKPKPV